MKLFYSNILTVILILTSISSPLEAASFNCRKAATEVEKMICGSPRLDLADKKMGIAYQNLRRALSKSERELLLDDQRAWLQERDDVLLSCTEADCEVQFYQIRIDQLKPIEAAGFNCRKAATSVEKKICRSTLLSHADGRVAKLYKPVKNELRHDQRQWLKERNTKFNQPYCDVECAWQFYKERIEFLVRYAF